MPNGIANNVVNGRGDVFKKSHSLPKIQLDT